MSHTDLDKALGETLRSMRLNAGLTQTAAAEQLGTSQPSVARWEAGQTSPDARTFVCATALYGSSPAQVYSTPVVQEATQDAVDEVTARAQRLAQDINKRQSR